MPKSGYHTISVSTEFYELFDSFRQANREWLKRRGTWTVSSVCIALIGDTDPEMRRAWTRHVKGESGR